MTYTVSSGTLNPSIPYLMSNCRGALHTVPPADNQTVKYGMVWYTRV